MRHRWSALPHFLPVHKGGYGRRTPKFVRENQVVEGHRPSTGETTRPYRAEHGLAHVLDPGSSDRFLRHRPGKTQPPGGLRRGVGQGHLDPGAGARTGGPCPLFVLTLAGWALTRR